MIEVFHFGDQCPWYRWAEAQARVAAAQLGLPVRTVDLDPAAAPAGGRPTGAPPCPPGVFFPFLTVIGGFVRVPAPLPAGELVRLAAAPPSQGVPSPPASVLLAPRAAPRPEGVAEEVRPLGSGEAAAQACALCLGPDPGPDLLAGARAKEAWLARAAALAGEPALGFVAYRDGQPVGAAEFLPASLIPYPLPIGCLTDGPVGAAFLTCVYSSPDAPAARGLDYRGPALEALTRYLGGRGYRRLLVVAGRRSVYPNGPAAFFLARSFAEVASLGPIELPAGRDEMVLLQRPIRPTGNGADRAE